MGLAYAPLVAHRPARGAAPRPRARRRAALSADRLARDGARDRRHGGASSRPACARRGARRRPGRRRSASRSSSGRRRRLIGRLRPRTACASRVPSRWRPADSARLVIRHRGRTRPPAVDFGPVRARPTPAPAAHAVEAPIPMSAEELRAKIREIPDFPKPGILFYDITTLLKDPAAYKEAIDLMLEPYKGEHDRHRRRAWNRAASSSARRWPTSSAPGLVPVRKLGKLPAETITVEYALEYGSNTLEIHRDAIQPGQKVLIVDDLLATGGTVKGTIELIERLQGRGRRPGLPRRARLPQGPRPTRRTSGHQRHQVLSADRSHRRPHAIDRRRPATRATGRDRRARDRRGRRRDAAAADAGRGRRAVGARRRPTSTSAGAGSSASSPAS